MRQKIAIYAMLCDAILYLIVFHGKNIMLPNSLFVAYDSNLENLAIVLICNIDPDFPENNKMTGNFEKNVIFAILRFHFRKWESRRKSDHDFGTQK